MRQGVYWDYPQEHRGGVIYRSLGEGAPTGAWRRVTYKSMGEGLPAGAWGGVTYKYFGKGLPKGAKRRGYL